MTEGALVRGEVHSPHIVVSRPQGIALLVVGYAAVVSCALLLLGLVEGIQGYDDHRNIDAAVIFALVMALPFAWALFGVVRRTPLPALNHRPT